MNKVTTSIFFSGTSDQINEMSNDLRKLSREHKEPMDETAYKAFKLGLEELKKSAASFPLEQLDLDDAIANAEETEYWKSKRNTL